MPFSQIVHKQWTETGKISITETEAGAHVSGPFGDYDLVAVNKDDAAAAIYDIVTEDIVKEASRDEIDLKALMEAILKTTVDISELRIPHLMVALSRCLGEVAVALNPVPEYFEDESVRYSYISGRVDVSLRIYAICVGVGGRWQACPLSGSRPGQLGRNPGEHQDHQDLLPTDQARCGQHCEEGQV